MLIEEKIKQFVLRNNEYFNKDSKVVNSVSQSKIYQRFLNEFKHEKEFDLENIKQVRIILNKIFLLNPNTRVSGSILENLGDLYLSKIGEEYLQKVYEKNSDKFAKEDINTFDDYKDAMILNAFDKSMQLDNEKAIQKYLNYIFYNNRNKKLYLSKKNKINRLLLNLPTSLSSKYEEVIFKLIGEYPTFETACEEKLVKENGIIDQLFFEFIDFSEKVNKTNQLKLEREHLSNFYDKMDQKMKELDESMLPYDRVMPYSAYDDCFFQNVSNQNINEQTIKTKQHLEKVAEQPYFKHFTTAKENSRTDYFFGKEHCYLPGFRIHSWTSQLYNDFVYKDSKYKDVYKKMIETDVKIKNREVEDIEIVYSNNSYNNIVVDSMLNKIKKSQKSTELKNIISTISYDQNQILRLPLNKNFVFDGCAGAGKTQILFHRIKFLLNNNKIKPMETVIISPNNNFNKMIKSLCKDLNINDIKIFTMVQFYSFILNEYTGNKSGRIGWNELIHPKNTTEYESVIIKEDYLLDQNIVNYYYSDELFTKINQLSKITIKQNNLENLRKNIVNKKIDVLKFFFNDTILNLFPKYKRELGIIHKCELYALLLCFFKRCNNNHKYRHDKPGYLQEKINYNYSMFFIDEVQDYSKNELVLLKNITNNNKTNKIFNFFGDLNQNLNIFGLSNWEELKFIGDFEKYTINLNYRNTKEIVEFINREFKTNMKSIGLSGDPVEFVKSDEIEELIKKNSDLIIITNDLSKYDYLRQKYNNKFFDVYSTKGLEFDKVLVLNNNLSDKEAYIACSRAMNKLYVEH